MRAASDGTHWMLRMEPEEELLEALGRFAQVQGIRAAAVPMGIGQLVSASLGFWNGEQYLAKEVAEPVELVALQGSIAESDGRASVHLHATLGTRSHETIAGHLLRGKVGILAEILVEAFPSRVFGRPLDETLGLRVLDLEPRERSP